MDKEQSPTSLEAGPELDALVAGKLGYPVIRRKSDNVPGILVKTEYREPYFVPIPGYSTEIDMAWKIVDFMITTYTTWISVSSNGGAWSCHYEVKSKRNSLVSYGNGFRADTAPLAICRAFLALKLDDGEGLGESGNPPQAE